MTKGVYCIKNSKTGFCYIGSSLIIEQRIKEHFIQLGRNCHHNYRLQAAYKIHKIHFRWHILEEMKGKYIDRDKLYDREQHYLDSTNKLYNILLDARAHLIESREERLKVGLSPRQRKLKL